MKLVLGPYRAKLEVHTHAGEPVGDMPTGKYGKIVVFMSERQCPGMVFALFFYDGSGARWDDENYETDRYMRTSICGDCRLLLGSRLIMVNTERQSRFEFVLETEEAQR